MTEALTLPTDLDGLEVRQLSVADAQAYFEAVDASRDHLSQFGDKTAAKYPDLQSVEASLKNPPDPTKLRFGIWKKDTFVGSINIKPDEEGAEIGYWLDGRHLGYGYATFALRAIGAYATDQFGKVHAWVKQGNGKSVAVMTRAGFIHTHNQDDLLIFELSNTAK